MPPTSDGGDSRAYTVACAAKRAIPDVVHVAKIASAVQRTHRATFAVTELLNLFVRDRLEHHGATGLDRIFESNWLIQAFYAVTRGRGKAQVDPMLSAVRDAHMADVELVDRTGLTQVLTYECINLQAVGSTNVWMHFKKRVLSYTRTAFALSDEDFKALSKDDRRQRKLSLLQAADDVGRASSEPLKSPAAYHPWVVETRARLGIETAVGDWNAGGDDAKPLLYHLKSKPHRFLKAMHVMSVHQHAHGRKSMALFPLRRSHVPCHIRFDQRALDDLLGLGHQHKKTKATKASNSTVAVSSGGGRAPKRKRNDPSLLAEKMELFNEVLDLRAAGVHRRDHFAFAFTTDGVSVHLNMERPKTASSNKGARKGFPVRGIHAIDALKAAAKHDKLERPPHVIGIDPGKQELLVAVDHDAPRSSRSRVRYTMAQRQRDLRTRQYADEMRRSKPQPVAVAEGELSLCNSKAPSLVAFAKFASTRRALMRECAAIEWFYDQKEHRHRRRKTKIKAQQSEARLVQRLRGLHHQSDDGGKKEGRPLVLAYGSWGLVAGRPGMACNKGTPPCIGVGLMKKLAKHFVVAPTPEAYTSKTCVACGGVCGAHPTLKTKNNKDIRGLRLCQQEGCGLLQNRDRTGATNIGTQFVRLLGGQPPIRPLSDEELAFHALNVCLERHHDS